MQKNKKEKNICIRVPENRNNLTLEYLTLLPISLNYFNMEQIEHINRIELQGYVGTVRANEYNGTRVANFTVATELLYKTREGAAASETTWHNVVAWDGKGMPDLDRIAKGVPVNVTGRLRVNKYTSPDGTEKYFYEVLANRVNILRNDRT